MKRAVRMVILMVGLACAYVRRRADSAVWAKIKLPEVKRAGSLGVTGFSSIYPEFLG